MNGFVGQAVQAFEEVERVKLLLEKKEQTAFNAVLVMVTECDESERAEYVTLTNEILAKYEAKREKAGV